MNKRSETHKAEVFDADKVLNELDAAEREGGTSGASSLFESIQNNQGRFASRHDLERKARIRMAALKRFMPLILGVIHRPGADGSVGEKSDALGKMMDSSYVIADEVAQRCLGDGVVVSDFVRDQALSAVSEIVATNWAFNGNTNVRPVVMQVMDNMAEMGDVVERLASNSWRPGGNIERHELEAGLSMSLLKASEPIQALLLDYGISNEDLFAKFQDMLVEMTNTYIGRISDELPSSTRLTMAQNHLSISSRILKVALANELNQHRTPKAEALNLKEVVRVWHVGVRMLDAAVESRVKTMMDGLLKAAPKGKGMEP